MKQLAEFNTLAEAKAYTYTQGKLIPRTTMNSLLGDAGLMIALEVEAKTDDRFAAFMHPTSTEYNFMIGNPTGDKQIAMLDDIIAEGKFPALAALKPVVLHIANPVTYPHANASEYDFNRAKGLPIAQKQVTPVNGYIKITLTQNVEAHRPQVYADVQGVKQRVTGFGLVDKAGDYLAQVPRGHVSFYVDDAYGAIA